ncbi:reverse transcriptase domain-containing protein [Tanacetum coccineum]
MEEMINKFIDEGKREHEEMRAFIYDFQTNNELLFKERNNSLIELRFGVQELLNAINNVPTIDCDVKEVITRGGKATTLDDHDNDTNVLPKEPIVVELEKPAESNKNLTNDQPQITSKLVVQPSNEVQPPPVPFPKRFRKERDKAQQKKFLENLKQLYINLPFIEALAQMPKCSVVLLNKLPSKEKDPGSFTIPCDIGQLHIDNALADLGASISLRSYTMYKKLGLGEPKATRMSLELADRSIQYLRGIIKNLLIKVDKFVLLIDFVILDMPEDSRVPIILGRPFLATARAMIDVFNKKITLRVGDDEVIFKVDQSIKRPTTKDDECYWIDELDEMINGEAQELLTNEEPGSFLLRDWKNQLINQTYNVANLLVRMKRMGLIQKNQYGVSTLSIRHSSWVIPIHVVPKKGGMTVVLNDNNQLIPSQIVTGWRVYIDYRKLNDATRKDHFPLPFINQMLERLCGNEYYYFLDGFSGFFQIPITPEDQGKTTFTCPYGTFAYCRMPFGLSNAPATFQRCMTAIFHDMVEDFMEVFMDDFSVFGNSFDYCLANLDRMLARYYYSEDQYAVSIKKIRRIRACTHQRPQKIKDQYAVSRGLNTPYSRYEINIIFWKISNVVLTPRNSNTSYPIHGYAVLQLSRRGSLCSMPSKVKENWMLLSSEKLQDCSRGRKQGIINTQEEFAFITNGILIMKKTRQSKSEAFRGLHCSSITSGTQSGMTPVYAQMVN